MPDLVMTDLMAYMHIHFEKLGKLNIYYFFTKKLNYTLAIFAEK